MSLNNTPNPGVSVGSSGTSKSPKLIKRVADIILDSTHIAYSSPDDLLTIFFTDEKTKEFTNDTTTLPRAKPLNLNNYTAPLIGELVPIESGVSNDYYADIGGNPNLTTNYYGPALNVHSNAGSNALPNETTQKTTQKRKTSQREPNFEFQKEFRTSGSQDVAVKMLNNYLRTLGLGGRSDPRSPVYTLFQDAEGDYILRLDDSKDNKVKLGNYYKENPKQKNLNLTEGGTVNQGKAGQRISYAANNKPNTGDLLEHNRAMVLSLGDGDTENINNDDGGNLYVLSKIELGFKI